MSDRDLLAAERQAHTLNLIRAELHEIRLSLQHQAELFERRFRHIEACTEDHEKRLRQNTEAVTQLKVQSYISTGGSWVVSAAALLKAFIGR
jgi:hypothetical protein